MIRSGMTRRIVLSVVAPTVVACAAALVGCDTEGEDITTETGASFSSSIHGIACGILYQNNSQLIVDGACDNVRTAGFNPPPGWPWELQSDGDRGLSSGKGFWHQSWHVNNVSNTATLVLPQGTACGFKESGNNSAENCFGIDTKLGCPAGWDQKQASDINAPSGTNFFWCQYRDDSHLCLSGSCLGNMPRGLACGITDSDRDNGTCLGQSTKSSGCPAGFQLRGYYDWGRPSGHGVGWCEKM